jgi:hypothetical protein
MLSSSFFSTFSNLLPRFSHVWVPALAEGIDSVHHELSLLPGFTLAVSRDGLYDKGFSPLDKIQRAAFMSFTKTMVCIYLLYFLFFIKDSRCHTDASVSCLYS